MASLEGNNLLVFCYLGASEIWPNKRYGLDGGDLIQEGDY